MLDPDWQSELADLFQASQRDLQVIAALRRDHPKEEVDVALQLTRARLRAKGRIDAATRLLADPEGVEQASGSAVARIKAERFARLGGGSILDLCCGIGGDAIELRKATSADICGVDRDPLRRLMTEHNAGVETRQGDVTRVDTKGSFVHLDPGRRVAGGGRRLWNLRDLQPGIDACMDLLLASSGGGLKLGPGVQAAELPRREAFELEFIGDRRSLYQAVLWTGRLMRSPGKHRATRVRDGASVSGVAQTVLPLCGKPGPYVLVPEPVLERAGLVMSRLDHRVFGTPAPGLGLIRGPTSIDDDWFEQYRVLEELPWRPKQIKAWLDANDGGEVVVRSRGGAVDTDAAQLELRGDGATGYTIFGLRLGKKLVCWITTAA